MSDKQTNIKFSAVDGGLSNFMKKLQTDAKKLYSDLAQEATKQGLRDKEQNKFVQERLRLLQEELKVKKQIAQETLKAAQESYKFAVADEDAKGMKKYSAVIEEQKRVISQLGDQSRTNREAAKQNPQVQADVTKQVVAGILASDAIKGVLRAMSGAATASTGIQLLTPMAKATGSALGALGGAAFLASGGGAVAGGELGEFGGAAYTRHINAKYGLEAAQKRYRGLTGSGIEGLGSLSDLGVSQEQGYGTAEGMSREMRRRVTSQELSTFLGLQKGYGVDQGTLSEGLNSSRSDTSGINRMQKVLGVAIAEGLDRAKFTDAIKNSNQLVAQFAQTTTHVNSDRINRLLFEFNKMGGAFSIGDPRSLERISMLNNSLANPGSPFGQAMNYSVLRGLPGGQNGSVFDLVGMQEKGLQTPGFLKGVIDQYKSMGLSDDFQKLMFKSRTGMNNEDINTIFKNYGGLETMSQGQLGKMLSSSKIRAEGAENTGTLSKYESEAQDAFVSGMLDGVKTISTQFKDQMLVAIKELADSMMETTTTINNERDYEILHIKAINSGNPAEVARVDKMYKSYKDSQRNGSR